MQALLLRPSHPDNSQSPPVVSVSYGRGTAVCGITTPKPLWALAILWPTNRRLTPLSAAAVSAWARIAVARSAGVGEIGSWGLPLVDHHYALASDGVDGALRPPMASLVGRGRLSAHRAFCALFFASSVGHEMGSRVGRVLQCCSALLLRTGRLLCGAVSATWPSHHGPERCDLRVSEGLHSGEPRRGTRTVRRAGCSTRRSGSPAARRHAGGSRMPRGCWPLPTSCLCLFRDVGFHRLKTSRRPERLLMHLIRRGPAGPVSAAGPWDTWTSFPSAGDACGRRSPTAS